MVAWWWLVAFACSTSPSTPTPEAGAHVPDPQRGRHLADHVFACTSCHGADLGGGYVPGDAAVARVWAPNLTQGEGGVGRAYDLDAWVAAMRDGVAASGAELVWMPSVRWRAALADDLSDVAAALEVVQPVDREPGVSDVPLSVRVAASLPGFSPPPPPPRPGAWGPVPAYGDYLVRVMGCDDCHGVDLAGGPAPLGGPAVPGIDAASLTGWTGAEFADAVVRGRGRDGRVLHPTMPWRSYAGLADTELDALWAALRPSRNADVTVRAP